MKTAVKYCGLLAVGLFVGAILGFAAGMPSLEERKALEDVAKLVKERSTLQSLLEEKVRQLERVQNESQRVKSDLETAESMISSLLQEIKILKAELPTPSVRVNAEIERRGFLSDDLLIEVRNITNVTLENVKILVISVDRKGEVNFSPLGIGSEERIPRVYPGERAIVRISPLTKGESYKIIVATTGGKIHVATAG